MTYGSRPITFRRHDDPGQEPLARKNLVAGLECVPRVVITGKLGSYQAARRRVARSIEHR